MPMFNIATRAGSWAFLIALGAASSASASFVSTNPDPFTVGNRLVGADACLTGGPLSGICTTNNVTTILSSDVSFPSSGNEYAVVNATLTGDLSGGLGSYSLTGTYDFTLFGRSLNPAKGTFLGKFPLEETFVNLQGVVLGHAVQLVADPSNSSTGFASIMINGNVNFLIDIGLTVNALFIVDNGEGIPASTTITGASAVPEPSIWAMTLLGFGLAGTALRRRHALEASVATA